MSVHSSLTATGTLDLGNTGEAAVGSFVIHVSGTWVGSIVTRGWLHANNSSLTASDFQAIAYIPLKTGTKTDPTVTAITANGVYEVPADGLNVVLDYTRTSGTVVIDAIPLRG